MRCLALLATLLWTLPVHAQGLVRAKGKVNNPTTECLSQFEGTPLNHPPSNPRIIKCVDNDLSCDADPTPGQCVILTSVRFNVEDPQNPECAQRPLDTYLVQNYLPDTHPKHDFSLEALELDGQQKLPLDANMKNVLSDTSALGVLLRVRPKIGDARWFRKAKLVRTRVDSLDDEVFDVDKLRIVCVPDDESSPCDNVTGTFDQIQKHIFNRGCAVPTCHTVAQAPHNLSLLAADAFASLVDEPPANAAALGNGWLRVDPSNPDNSYLLKKLRGELAKDDSEGERMPLGQRKVHRLFRDLVEDWIAAGAPAAGYVSQIGCQASP